MKYTWGYIKEATLAKLDIDEAEALERGLINKMPYYANEALTQICSTVKPKHVRITFKVVSLETAWSNSLKWSKEHNCVLPSEYYNKPCKKPAILTTAERYFWDNLDEQIYIGKVVNMPDDFLSFDDNAPMYTKTTVYPADVTMEPEREATDEDFVYDGDDKLIFKHVGYFEIYYNAIWFFFDSKTVNDAIVTMPPDIVMCIPSYIASQLFKVDDEVKAQVYRNEYELLFARIDDTYFKRPETITIGGGW